MKIRACWDNHRNRMKYYFGFTDLSFIGSSWIDEAGAFQMSETLKKFVITRLPMVIEYQKNMKHIAKACRTAKDINIK